MDSQPSKDNIEAVFTRLRTIPSNKTCFDCGSKNPTWSSVTYGVFICIDCSAIHRSLGVHLTFVRSTQLDTNWTWIQLRQMQLGGNANALHFFTQHNCITNDAQKKYNSRAAQLYRDKLNQLATNSLKINHDLHVTPHVEELKDDKEIDFFQDQHHFQMPDIPEQHLSKPDNNNQSLINCDDGPKIDFTSKPETIKKSVIANRKTPIKKSGLGVKKGGLGATKVKTNFADIEREAEIAEEARQRAFEETAKAMALSQKEQEERDAAVRLAYKDLSNEQLKREEQMKKLDPKKAEQVERLGMGVTSRGGISHSAISDMQEIEQENLQMPASTLSSLNKMCISDLDYFMNNITINSSSGTNYNMNRFNSKMESFLSETSSNNSHDSWVIIDDNDNNTFDKPIQPKLKNNSDNKTISTPTRNINTIDKSFCGGSGDEAQKKFGNAKAISSDQFFNNESNDYEIKANLNRFQGSSSISSADFFGNNNSDNNVLSSASSLQNYDLEDVKESVRQGVTKVAGKLSSLANGVMSSLQDRYGY